MNEHKTKEFRPFPRTRRQFGVRPRELHMTELTHDHKKTGCARLSSPGIPSMDNNGRTRPKSREIRLVVVDDLVVSMKVKDGLECILQAATTFSITLLSRDSRPAFKMYPRAVQLNLTSGLM
jgi:hypothetical protein